MRTLKVVSLIQAQASYGIYLNADALGNVQADTDGNLPTRFDLFVGGNSNMNWGARLGYETITNKTAALDEEAAGLTSQFLLS